MHIKTYRLSSILLCSSLLIFSAPQQRPPKRTQKQEARRMRNRLSAKNSRLNANARLQQARNIIAQGGINRPHTEEERATIQALEDTIRDTQRVINALPTNTTLRERNRLNTRASRLRKDLICARAGLLLLRTLVPPLPQTSSKESQNPLIMPPLEGFDFFERPHSSDISLDTQNSQT